MRPPCLGWVSDNSIYAREAFLIYINSGQYVTQELRAIRRTYVGQEPIVLTTVSDSRLGLKGLGCAITARIRIPSQQVDCSHLCDDACSMAVVQREIRLGRQ